MFHNQGIRIDVFSYKKKMNEMKSKLERHVVKQNGNK